MELNKCNILLLCCLFVLGCKEDVLPKPNAALRLEYPATASKQLELDCMYAFRYNQLARIENVKECSFELNYPGVKGTLFITYKVINNNLNKLLSDAQKLSFEHAIKADDILEQPFVNSEDKVYGMYYEVIGDAASQSQFYVTDSIHHFVTGSLYFYAKPNYDSILPAAAYLQEDIRKIMETFRWKNK